MPNPEEGTPEKTPRGKTRKERRELQRLIGEATGYTGEEDILDKNPENRPPQTAIEIASQKAVKEAKVRAIERGEVVANPNNPNTVEETRKDLRAIFQRVSEIKNIRDSVGVWEGEGGKIVEQKEETTKSETPIDTTNNKESLQEEKEFLVRLGRTARTEGDNIRLIEIEKKLRSKDGGVVVSGAGGKQKVDLNVGNTENKLDLDLSEPATSTSDQNDTSLLEKVPSGEKSSPEPSAKKKQKENKENWEQVDYELEKAVQKLKKVTKRKNKEEITRLQREVDNLKEKKFGGEPPSNVIVPTKEGGGDKNEKGFTYEKFLEYQKRLKPEKISQTKETDDDETARLEGSALTEAGWAKPEKGSPETPATPEQKEKTEKMLGVLKEQSQEHEEKAKKMGFMDYWRWTGERIKKMPLSARVGLGLGFAGLALATGGSAYVFAGAGIWRAVSSAGTFVLVEEALRASYEKGGKARTERQTKRHVAEALFLSVLVGSGLSGQALSNTLDFLKAEPMGSKTTIKSSFVSESVIPIKELIPPENLPGALATAHTIERGETLYKVIKSSFPEISSLEGGRQTNAIENILVEMKKDPQSFGVTSGNINNLKIGDEINIEKIREVLENKQIRGEKIIEHAQKLSGETVSRIESYVEPAEKTPLSPSDIKVDTPPYGAPTSTPRDPLLRYGAPITEMPSGQEENLYPDPETIGGEGGEEASQTKHPPGNLDSRDQISIEDSTKLAFSRLDDTFGKKGFLGFGNIHGAISPEWLSVKELSVMDVIQNKNPSETLTKVKILLGSFMGESGLTPKVGEKIEDFVLRSAFELVRTGKNLVT